MTLGQFSAFCRSLTATTRVIQPDGTQVWKVGGKVFATGREENGNPAFTFGVSDAAYETLENRAGLRPAPHPLSRDLKWIQYFHRRGLSHYGLRDYIRRSYIMTAKSLPAKRQIELGLEDVEIPKRRAWPRQPAAQKAGR